MRALQQFISAEMGKSFRWGETDCATTADRWVRSMRGFSPMARFGRQHSGPQDAAQWLSEPGSIAVAVNRVMRAGGFRKTEEPQAGDVGLVFHAGKLCMAICAGDIWFSRDENGFIGAPLGSVWKAWKV
jgi:hypothetical protein